MEKMKRLIPWIVGLAIVALAGCSGMSRQEQQALSGGAIGAAGGAIIGAMAGSPATGAAIGGAAGAATGALWDDIKQRM
jgi:osmotically inducible lipoprotein OsmB